MKQIIQINIRGFRSPNGRRRTSRNVSSLFMKYEHRMFGLVHVGAPHIHMVIDINALNMETNTQPHCGLLNYFYWSSFTILLRVGDL